MPVSYAYVHPQLLRTSAHSYVFTLSPVDSQQYPPTYSAPEYARGAQNDVRGDARYLTRTPSPTPSEAEVLSPQKKKRRGFLLALLNPETFKDPKELSE